MKNKTFWVIERDDLHEFHLEPTGKKLYFVSAIQSGDEKDWPHKPWRAYSSAINHPIWVEDIKYAMDFKTKEKAEEDLKKYRGKIFRNSDKVAQHIWTEREV